VDQEELAENEEEKTETEAALPALLRLSPSGSDTETLGVAMRFAGPLDPETSLRTGFGIHSMEGLGGNHGQEYAQGVEEGEKKGEYPLIFSGTRIRKGKEAKTRLGDAPRTPF